jgi:hypothetical protein
MKIMQVQLLDGSAESKFSCMTSDPALAEFKHETFGLARQ